MYKPCATHATFTYIYNSFVVPKSINGKNISFNDSDFDQSILDTYVANDLIACLGSLTLKNVPTVALFALLIRDSSGTTSSFSESINPITSSINAFSSGISLKASIYL